MTKRHDELAGLLAGEEEVDHSALRDLQAARADLLRTWAADPWAFLTGKDTTGRPIYWTKDEDDPDTPLKPFPADREYLRRLIDVVWAQGWRDHPMNLHPEEYNLPFGPFNRIVTIDKSRQMYVTTGIHGFGGWECAMRQARKWLISRSVEEDAIEFLREKVRFPWTQMPAWLQKALPCRKKPEVRVDFPRTASYMLAVGQNVQDREGVGGTASRVFIDEAPLQDDLDDKLAALLPMCPRIIMCGTPRVTRGARIFQVYLEPVA